MSAGDPESEKSPPSSPQFRRRNRNGTDCGLLEPTRISLTRAGWRQRDSMTVHLVNLTNPMMMKGPLRETIPVGPFTVRVRLPEGARPSRVRLLTAGVTAATQVANGTARLTVPSVDLHEVIAIDL